MFEIDFVYGTSQNFDDMFDGDTLSPESYRLLEETDRILSELKLNSYDLAYEFSGSEEVW
jgi:hypothetical protein